jgi:hypothetical protein
MPRHRPLGGGPPGSLSFRARPPARALGRTDFGLTQGLCDASGQRNDCCPADHSLAAPVGTRDRSAKGPIWRTERDPDPKPGNDPRAGGPVSDYSRSATPQPVGCGEPSGVPARKETAGGTCHGGSSRATACHCLLGSFSDSLVASLSAGSSSSESIFVDTRGHSWLCGSIMCSIWAL